MLNYRLREVVLSPFPRPEEMHPVVHKLLIHRGIDSPEAARRFLNPTADDLCDAMLLSDMEPAVRRIRAAISAREPICVYGDYDVDGVSASAILAHFLRAQWASVRVYLPSRHEEGYGLNERAMRDIAMHSALMITVDCGVTNVAEVALAKALGLSVVVTDHHRPGTALPDCPTVNPLLNGYPFPYLCGAGVAFKLVEALSDRQTALEYVDIAALATVADVVALTGENRVIVRLGLERMNREPRPGLRALRQCAYLQEKRISAGNIAFQIAPRLNAGGRMGSALRSHELLLAPDMETALMLAQALEAENDRRKDEEARILAQAEEQIARLRLPERSAIVLCGDDWNAGVIGLAAGRIAEKYHYPAILLCAREGVLTGSCRSIPGVDIHAALTAVQSHFVRFGGHRQAAGLTMRAEELQGFIADLEAWLSENVPPEAWIPEKEYDIEVPFDALSEALAVALEAVEPTGYGNPSPVFRTTAHVDGARAVGANGAHLSLTLSGAGSQRRGIFFGEGAQADALPDTADILYTPKINIFQGRSSVQVELRALRADDVRAELRRKMQDEAHIQHDFLTDSIYNSKIKFSYPIPERADMELLRQCLRERCQGVLLAVADGAQADALMEALGDIPLELCVGALREDARCFNTLWVYPVGEARGAWTHVFSFGVPVAAEGAQTHMLAPIAPIWQALPDIDGLRALYQACRRVSQGAERWYTLHQLLYLLSSHAGLSTAGCLMGLFALRDAALISFEPNGVPVLRMERVRKVDPTQSETYMALESMRRL